MVDLFPPTTYTFLILTFPVTTPQLTSIIVNIRNQQLRHWHAGLACTSDTASPVSHTGGGALAHARSVAAWQSHPFRVRSVLHPTNLMSIRRTTRKTLTLTLTPLTTVNLRSLLVYTLPHPPPSQKRGQRQSPHIGFSGCCTAICHIMSGPGVTVSLRRPWTSASDLPSRSCHWSDLASAVFSTMYS